MRDYGPILVPLDGSELSEGALAYGAALAKTLGTKLVLLTSWEGVSTDLAASLPTIVVDVDKRAQTYFGDYLEGARKKVPAGVESEVIVRSGDAADEILSVAESKGARAIVLATHGRSGIGRWVYGSTAAQVVHTAAIPVIAVGPNALQQARADVAFKRILIALDGSKLAEAAIPAASSLAKSLGARVTLVRVVPWATQAYPYTLPDTYVPQIDQELESAATAYLRKHEKLVTEVPVDAFVVRGAVADGLIDFVDREGIDLVVMTTHARRGLARAALGSVADRLLQSAAPVMLIRPDAE